MSTTPPEFELAKPVGSDLIRDGDNAITQNANVLEALLGSSFRIVRMPNNANWAELPNGIYLITSYSHAEGITPALPAELLGAGVLKVIRASEDVHTFQLISAGDRGTWVNTRNDGAWLGWRKYSTGGREIQQMPYGGNWSAQPDGDYTIPSTAHAASLTPALPAELQGSGILRVTWMTETDRIYELVTGGDRGMWLNTRTGTTLRGWRRLTQGGLDFQRMPNNSDYSTLPDGVYQIETLAHAQQMTPPLPSPMGAAVMRITSASASVRTFELVSGGTRGTWVTTLAGGVVGPWRKLAEAGEDGGGDLDPEVLSRYVLEGDARLYDPRRTLSTGWRLLDTTDTTGTIRTAGALSVRRVGTTVHARLAGVTLAAGDSPGTVFLALPAGYTPAGATVALTPDAAGGWHPLLVTAAGLEWTGGTRPTEPLTGLVSWFTEDDDTVFYEGGLTP